jgi:prepilin-type N-terminal cleavage/methylation domain-containing protein
MKKIKDNKGFTIIELMIATAILGLVLLLVTEVMMSMGKLYYKGVSLTRIQNDARTITDQVSQDIKYSNQFSSGSGSEPYTGATDDSVAISSYCIGSVRYSYILDYMIGDTNEPVSNTPEVPDVIVRDNTNASLPASDLVTPYTGGCQPLNLTSTSLLADDSSATELMASNSRLTNFSISGSGPYTINVDVAYGFLYLLTPTSTTPATPWTCNGGDGDDFCGSAGLQTSVVQTLTGGS